MTKHEENEALYSELHSTEMRVTEFDMLIASTTEPSSSSSSSSSSAAAQQVPEEDTSDSEDEEARTRTTSATTSSNACHDDDDLERNARRRVQFAGNKGPVISSVFGPDVDDLWDKRKDGDRRYGQRQKRKAGRTAGMLLPPEVAEPLAEANYHYLAGNYPGIF